MLVCFVVAAVVGDEWWCWLVLLFCGCLTATVAVVMVIVVVVVVMVIVVVVVVVDRIVLATRSPTTHHDDLHTPSLTSFP